MRKRRGSASYQGGAGCGRYTDEASDSYWAEISHTLPSEGSRAVIWERRRWAERQGGAENESDLNFFLLILAIHRMKGNSIFVVLVIIPLNSQRNMLSR